MSDVSILRATLIPAFIKDSKKLTTGDKETLKLNKLIFSKEFDTFVKPVDEYCQNKFSIHFIILGQHTDLLITKLEALDNCDNINSTADAI